MDGGENGGMVSVLENGAYIVERKIGKASDKIYAHMAGNGNIFASALTLDFIGAYGEISCGFLDDYIGVGTNVPIRITSFMALFTVSTVISPWIISRKAVRRFTMPSI